VVRVYASQSLCKRLDLVVVQKFSIAIKGIEKVKPHCYMFDVLSINFVWASVPPKMDIVKMVLGHLCNGFCFPLLADACIGGDCCIGGCVLHGI
jgi:hypothetical protein